MADITRAFGHRAPNRLFRGELWLGTDLLKRLGLEDDLRGHLSLVQRLDHDIFCLPVSNEKAICKALGYRYFSTEELKEAKEMGHPFVAALIDGPLQRLADKRGLWEVLARWRQTRGDFVAEYQKECSQAASLLSQCLELSVDAVVIADDLSGERSPLISLHDIRSLFSPFYAQMVSEAHSAHSYALFHSCGNLSMLIPELISTGFDGLAAIQHKTNDLRSIKEQYGSQLTLMGGIDADIMEAMEVSSSELEDFTGLVQCLQAVGGFVIGSCCGLYSGRFLERVIHLYRIADQIVQRQRNEGGET